MHSGRNISLLKLRRNDTESSESFVGQVHVKSRDMKPLYSVKDRANNLFGSCNALVVWAPCPFLCLSLSKNLKGNLVFAGMRIHLKGFGILSIEILSRRLIIFYLSQTQPMKGNGEGKKSKKKKMQMLRSV